ncbi:MAG TPA: DUF1003 domain-containing protein [Candidatus Binataceae bacterium]|nr:DUF1003 domain-containing protein [Candidatus Binataceae bacterium]
MSASITEKNVIDRWERLRVRHAHKHPPVTNVNEALAQSMTFGERASDAFAATMGSWPFIIAQSILLVFWVILNVTAWILHWDPYPFILLNLALSLEAAYAAPIIMMSQNRQADKDRLAAEEDYRINTKAEEELKDVMHHLEQQDELMLDILRRLEDQHQVVLGRLGVGNLANTPA